MKIIIVGDGKVGYTLAKNLTAEKNDITIIDNDAEALRKAADELDVMSIQGNGLSSRILIEAGCRTADLVIAVTTNDEMNMVCCMTAKKLGAAHTVARIRDPEYADELAQIKADLDLDMVINPERATAGEIARLIEYPAAIEVDTFASGRVEMVELEVTTDLSISGLKLKDIPSKVAGDILIGGVVRGDDVFIPNGEFQLLPGDLIYVFGRPAAVTEFFARAGKPIQKIRTVMITGGGLISYYLASTLQQMGVKVKIIEHDYDRCIELNDLLPETMIIHGDGTDESLLLSENLTNVDAFISLTGRDEENLIAALTAKQHGVRKVVAKINRINYSSTLEKLGIDNIVSPKLITAGQISHYVRGLKNARGNPANTLYKIMNNKAEAAEFTAGPETLFLNKPLKEIRFIPNVLVAAIVYDNQVSIPHGNDVIREGVHIIVVAKDMHIDDLNDIVRRGPL